MRVLLHSMTFRRDYGMIYVLSKLLERRGCECLLTSTETFVSLPARAWNPHAIFYVTPSAVQHIAPNYPNAKLFLSSAEGAHDLKTTPEGVILKEPELYQRHSGIYVWGKFEDNNIRQIIRDESLTSSYEKMGDPDLRKCILVAHPRLDLIKFSPQHTDLSKKTKIGFIGNGYGINSIGRHPITFLLDQKNGVEWEHVNYGFALLFFYLNITKILGHDHFAYSYRPYPTEDPEPYLKSNPFLSGQIELSTHIDFSTWINEQDIIIGDLSETYATIYAAKKKYICISKAIPFSHTVQDEKVVHKIEDFLSGWLPTSVEEAVRLCRCDAIFNHSSELKDFMNDLYNVDFPKPSLSVIADHIVSELHKSRKKNYAHLPLLAVNALNKLNMYYKNPKTSYSSFLKNDLSNKASLEFDPIVKNIIEFESKQK